MLPLYQLIILSLVQGLTEFLPISSSTHLAILPYLFHWEDQGLMLDVAVHFGTLFAVILYFARDTINMTAGGFDFLRNKDTFNRAFFLQLVIATIPVVIMGGFVGLLLENGVRYIEVMAWSSIVFGALLYLVDRYFPLHKTLDKMTYKLAFLAGLGQSLAVIPGTSRTGSSMTALRALGFNRIDTAHFSYLMSIPTIIAASVLMGYKLIKVNQIELFMDVAIAVVLSFMAGYISISFMMRWIQRSTFSIFGIYRICLGLFLLSLLYWP